MSLSLRINFGLCVCMAVAPFTASHADLQDLLKALPLPGAEKSTSGAIAASALSNDEVVAGLKEALAKGSESAISALGRTDGFFANSQVRIPLPPSLGKIESALRALKQDRYADEFILTMNRAAESAVPQASAIVGDAIRAMSFDDAKTILSGPDDAATQYFRKVGEGRLVQNMLPIVRQATAETGVTSTYKSLIDRAGPAARLLGDNTADIDQYVTGKTIDGLFLMIAAEEKRIRENPVARTSDILKKVFAGIGR